MITSANEGYLHAEILKNVNDSVLFGKSVKYTSCEYDHPHFYIEINQAKIIKDKISIKKVDYTPFSLKTFSTGN